LIIQLHESAEYPRLVFENDVHDCDIAPLGFRGDVCVEFTSGETFPIYFYEPIAVQEELAARSKWGLGCYVSEPGLVIVPQITIASMKAVVAELLEIGHFKHLMPKSG
jgi:hypothetical protein